MLTITRRNFLYLGAIAPFADWKGKEPQVVTVNGQISVYKLGKTLVHEHVLVDFIGADKTNDKRWDKTEVVNRVAPFFMEAKAAGVNTIVECTPAFLGRDPRLLKMLSDKTGIRIITNTGYYGAGNNKFLPPWAFTETAEQLAARWIDDFDYGIDGTTVKPGIIKISVDGPNEGLSDLHRKLVRAAALTHLKTGLIIYSHTGPAKAAFEQMDILEEMKVSPEAFVWVHAQVEKDKTTYIKAAKKGAWVSLDGIGSDFDDYADSLALLKQEGLLNRTVISHDAGWYRPGEPEGGDFRGYLDIFKELLPRLTAKGFVKKDIDRLLYKNPCDMLELKVRKKK